MRTGKINIGSGKQHELSKVILGTAEFGIDEIAPKATAMEIMDAYFEAGGRTLDTAREYLDFIPFGSSASERTIGEWLRAAGVRDQMTIITKGACEESRSKAIPRVERKCIENDLMTSLAVMGLDYVDGFLLHKDDKSVPVSEIMDTLDDIVKAGYAKFVGASNWTISRVNEANKYAVENGKVPFAVSEIYWNMAKPVPGCAGGPTNLAMDDAQYAGYLENKMPVLAYSSQAIGFFSKYLSGQELVQPRAKALLTEDNIARAKRCKEICNQYGISPAALCLAYISCNKVDGYPIVGNHKAAHLRESMQAFDLVIDQKAIDYIVSG